MEMKMRAPLIYVKVPFAAIARTNKNANMRKKKKMGTEQEHTS